MFKVYLTNFGYFLDREFNSLESAVNHARSVCFECSIYKGDEVIGHVGVFSGFVSYYKMVA